MNPPSKRFYRGTEAIRPLVTGRGACIATDCIMVEGRRVGWMYREEPNNPVDSGWRFFCGTESEEYLAREENLDFYDVNTVANYDPDIVPFLDAPIGSAFERAEGSGALVPVVASEENPLYPPQAGVEGLNPAYPAAGGAQPLPDGWSVHLPRLFSRRLEGNELVVFWRPGLTLRVSVTTMETRPSPNDKLARMKQIVPEDAFEVEEIPGGRLARLAYRQVTVTRLNGERQLTQVLQSFVFSGSGYADLTIYADDEADIATARSIWLSVDQVQPV